jgi:chloramphenicol O-acetyltransferase
VLFAFGAPPELKRNKKSFPKKTQNEKILSVIMMKTLPRLKWTHANMHTEKKKGKLITKKKILPKKTQKILSVIMMKTLPRLKWTHANMSTEKKKGKLIKKILRYLMLKTLPRLKLTGDAKTKKRLVGAAMVQVTHIYVYIHIYLFRKSGW